MQDIKDRMVFLCIFFYSEFVKNNVQWLMKKKQASHFSFASFTFSANSSLFLFPYWASRIWDMASRLQQLQFFLSPPRGYLLFPTRRNICKGKKIFWFRIFANVVLTTEKIEGKWKYDTRLIKLVKSSREISDSRKSWLVVVTNFYLIFFSALQFDLSFWHTGSY